MRKRKHLITQHELHKVSKIKKHRHHHLIHHIHKKHRLSYKTIFYMKEYGPKSHITTVIVKESIKIMILASIISSLGGVQLQAVESKLIAFAPLIILLPALSSMIGSFGTIASTKFTTLLFLGKIKKKWWETKEVDSLISTLFIVALISAVYVGVLAFGVSLLKGFQFSWLLLFKTMFVSLVAAVCMVGLIIVISIVAGMYIFKKKEDPNNFLIPIATSMGDFGSMFIISVLATVLF